MVYIKLSLILLLIILLMRLKIGIGVSLLFSSIFIGILFLKNVYDIPNVFITSLSSYITIKTVLIVYGVLLLSYIMRERQIDRMVGGLKHLFKNIKYAILLPPMIIGLMPMPGGAMLPAPIIDEMGSPLKLSQEKKTYINYWFRHIWEYCWPLYPGLILAASIKNISLKSIMYHQFYLTILAFITGLMMIFDVKNREVNEGKTDVKKGFLSLFHSILPIFIMIILIIVTSIPEEIVVLGVTFIYLIFSRSSFKKKIEFIIKSFSPDSILLIIGVMIFKDFLIASSSLNTISETMSSGGFSILIPLILMPAIIGFLTGINQAYVGIALPILVPFIAEGSSVDFTKLTLFYAAGFVGVLLSPMHLCLSLTREYFKAKWSNVYRILIPSVIPILLIPLLIYLFL